MTEREFLFERRGIYPNTLHPDDLTISGTYLMAIPRDVLDMIAIRVSRQWTSRMLRRWYRRLAIKYSDLPRLFPNLDMSPSMTIKFYDRRRVMIASATTVYFYLKVAGVYYLQNKHIIYSSESEHPKLHFMGDGQFIATRYRMTAIMVCELNYVRWDNNAILLTSPDAARIMPCGEIVQQQYGSTFLYGSGIHLPRPPHADCIFDDHCRAVPHNLPLDALLMSPATVLCRVLRSTD